MALLTGAASLFPADGKWFDDEDDETNAEAEPGELFEKYVDPVPPLLTLCTEENAGFGRYELDGENADPVPLFTDDDAKLGRNRRSFPELFGGYDDDDEEANEETEPGALFDTYVDPIPPLLTLCTEENVGFGR